MPGPRIALLGHGIWGRIVLRDLLALGAEVEVVEPDAARRAEAERSGAARVAADPDGLGPVDGVIVASPATHHAADVERVLPLGVPVFCEKPFTTSAASARHLAELGGDDIHVMHIWRYHPGVELLGEIARSGAIGRPLGVRSTRANWTSPRTDTDPVWTLAPHDLTLAIEILGRLPTPRAAVAELHDGRPVSLWGHCGGGDEPFLVVEASTRFTDKRREVRVHGDEGVAVLPGLDADAVEIATGTEARPVVERRSFDDAEPLVRELGAWLAHLDGGPPPKSDCAEGVAVVEAVEHLRRLAGVVDA
ncbi:MAG: Gfo/Idh/MocA family oxidoreductase [Actinomycetota bacterium]